MLGGAINLSAKYSVLVRNCTIEDNNATYNSSTNNLRISGTVIFEGKVNTTVYSNGKERLQVNDTLDADSKITVTMDTSASVLKDGNTVVTFDSLDGMNACQTNGNLTLTNEGYTLSYETTSDSKYIAKLISAAE